MYVGGQQQCVTQQAERGEVEMRASGRGVLCGTHCKRCSQSAEGDEAHACGVYGQPINVQEPSFPILIPVHPTVVSSSAAATQPQLLCSDEGW